LDPEGHCWGIGREGDRPQKPKPLKESMRLNLNFQGVGSSNQENYSSGRLQHFPEQHIYTRGGERQCRAKFILYGNKTVHF